MSLEIEEKEQTDPIWRCVGVSVPGTSHLKADIPCHDSFDYKLLPHGELIIVVSDGAGSAAHAELGSALAVETVIACLEEQLMEKLPTEEDRWEKLVSKAFYEARNALEQKAAETEIDLREYAATLVVLVLAEGWTVGAMIGDGAAVVLNEADELLSLCAPQKGEYANMTNFLIMPDALERVDIQVRQESASSAAAFSDGLLELSLNIAENRPFQPFFTPLFAFVEHIEDEQEAQEQLKGFLNSGRINARTDDDKTLVLASRNIAQVEPEPQAEEDTQTPKPGQEETQKDASQE